MVVDYSIHGLVLYSTLAHRLFPVANRGVQLVRLVLAASPHQHRHFPVLLTCALQLIDELASIPSGASL